MNRVDELLIAVEQLSLEEQAEFFKRLHMWQDDDWDRQIAADVETGKLDRAIAKIRADVKSGKLLDLP